MSVDVDEIAAVAAQVKDAQCQRSGRAWAVCRAHPALALNRLPAPWRLRDGPCGLPMTKGVLCGLPYAQDCKSSTQPAARRVLAALLGHRPSYHSRNV